MPDFPDITPSEPVVKPAQEEKIYNKLWLEALNVDAPKPGEPVKIYIRLIPMSEAGEVLQSPAKTQIIPDAFGLAAQDPEFAQALGAVIAMANKYKDHVFVEPGSPTI